MTTPFRKRRTSLWSASKSAAVTGLFSSPRPRCRLVASARSSDAKVRSRRASLVSKKILRRWTFRSSGPTILCPAPSLRSSRINNSAPDRSPNAIRFAAFCSFHCASRRGAALAMRRLDASAGSSCSCSTRRLPSLASHRPASIHASNLARACSICFARRLASSNSARTWPMRSVRLLISNSASNEFPWPSSTGS